MVNVLLSILIGIPVIIFLVGFALSVVAVSLWIILASSKVIKCSIQEVFNKL